MNFLFFCLFTVLNSFSKQIFINVTVFKEYFNGIIDTGFAGAFLTLRVTLIASIISSSSYFIDILVIFRLEWTYKIINASTLAVYEILGN